MPLAPAPLTAWIAEFTEPIRSDGPSRPLIYHRTKNLRAIQLLFGHTKLESTVRYLGIDIDDALGMAEKTEL